VKILDEEMESSPPGVDSCLCIGPVLEKKTGERQCCILTTLLVDVLGEEMQGSHPLAVSDCGIGSMLQKKSKQR